MDLAKIVGSSPIGVALFAPLLYSGDADCGDELWWVREAAEGRVGRWLVCILSLGSTIIFGTQSEKKSRLSCSKSTRFLFMGVFVHG